ncbi:unnamed protein product [Macrosiphum euphorbiae]|uniref:THAP-type domain-containing protein n=1 Tax=Macrosiphum euphorbiae TaxID=13131 RepID=A0AAV0W1W3_9HEMI|nr:unnamed protein product [Macrosiphum euphorbiae]
MVHKCSVAGCRQKYIKGLSFFKVPFHDAVRSKKWTNVIGINETSNKNCFVCERHFKSCDFDHNGIGVNVKKLKLSAVPSLFLPVIEIVNAEYEHSHNDMELSFDFEEVEMNNDDVSDENLPLNRNEMNNDDVSDENLPLNRNETNNDDVSDENLSLDGNEMNDSICNEKSPIKINDVTPKILFPQSLTSNQEILCDFCIRRQNILKAREYHLKKLAEIKEEESKLPLICPCENNENLKSNKQCMTPLDECNKFSTLTPKALARRAFTLDHSYISSPSRLIKHKNKNIKNMKIRKVKSKIVIQKCKRQIKVIKNIKLLLSYMKKKCGVQEKLSSYLEHTFPTAMSELFNRYRNGGRKCFSPELRAFALTLKFYSPKAYNFVREKFGSCLPHATTLRSWYHEINVEEGFTEASFTALKNEMHIKRQIEWDGKKCHGFSSIGNGYTSNDSELRAATQVLVILVVALDSSWKVPIGYFFHKGLNGKDKGKLVLEALKKLYEIDIQVPSLTFDGPSSHFFMAHALGANLSITNMKTFFHILVTQQNLSTA